MFGKIANTWSLMRASWMVLRLNKSLVLFPLLSGFFCIIVLASFAVPLIFTGAWELPKHGVSVVQQVAYYSVLFLFYMANYFVITFFNTAMAVCAVRTLRGEPTSLSDGLKGAMGRIHLIAGWAILSATVGLILRVLEDRLPKVGEIISGLLGMAFSMISFLVVPILAVEGIGPWAALKESGRLLKKTWGEQITGNFGFGLIFGLLGIPGIVLIGAGVAFFVMGMNNHGGASNLTLAVALGLGGFGYVLLLALVSSALKAIFQAAVYLYSRDGEVPEAFARSNLAEVFYQG